MMTLQGLAAEKAGKMAAKHMAGALGTGTVEGLGGMPGASLQHQVHDSSLFSTRSKTRNSECRLQPAPAILVADA